MWSVLLAFILAFFIAYFIQKWVIQIMKNLPPGPIGIPIFGYLPFLGKEPPLSFSHLSKKYGSIYSINLGSSFGIVLNDYKSLKEAFGKPEFLGRPKESIFKLVPQFEAFVAMSGPKWMEQRRFTLQALRNLGMNRSSFCLKIKEEIDYLNSTIRKMNGEVMDINPAITSSMSNNILSLVFGRRLEYEDPDRKKLDDALQRGNKLLNQTGVLTFIPWLTNILNYLNLLNLEEFLTVFKTVQNYIRKDVESHKLSYDPNNPRDYIDHYLVEMDKRDSSTNTTFTISMLAGNTQVLFGAGSNTVRTSVKWAILTLATYQDVQNKIRDEINACTGGNRAIEWEDHAKCVFTEAVLMELQRWKTVAPIGIVHSCLEDSTVGGYNVPANSFVISNLQAIHHDPEYWGDPENFRPSRFLDDAGKSLIKHEAYVPFSIGRRSCPGEGLALMENFLYVTTIVQNFRIKLAEGATPSFAGNTGLGFEPKMTTFQFIPL